MHKIINDTIKITVPKSRLFNERTYKFTEVKEQSIVLKHSLVSVYRWESIWKKSYLSEGPSTPEEKLSYYKCMTITQNVDPNAYLLFDDSDIEAIENYINDPMSATKIPNQNGNSRRKITSEFIYYWMSKFGIPYSCEKWHLQKLLTLLSVAISEESPKKKMSASEIATQNRLRNEARLAKYHTRG